MGSRQRHVACPRPLRTHTVEAFIAGGVDITDTRHWDIEAWPAIKGDPELVPAKIYGSMPSIKHCDMVLAQSKTTDVYARMPWNFESSSLVRNHGRVLSKQGDGVGSLVFDTHTETVLPMSWEGRTM